MDRLGVIVARIESGGELVGVRIRIESGDAPEIIELQEIQLDGPRSAYRTSRQVRVRCTPDRHPLHANLIG